MGTLAEGIKEIFATAKTTGSNVMLCGNDGTPDGHMTMSNLASVLGGPINGVLDSSIDLNNITTTGIYQVVNGNKPTNFPSDAGGNSLIEVRTFYYNERTIQIVYDGQGDNTVLSRTRSGSTWTSWTKTSKDMPTFYKNYADLSSLAYALGENLFSYSHSFIGDISQDYDAFIASLQTWYNSLPDNSIIITGFNFPGTGVCFGKKSSSQYGNFVILCDGFKTYKYVDVSGSTITTNLIEHT